MFKSVRKFNGAVDPHWDTAEGQAECGGYATFDHHMGGGSLKQAVDAARQEVEMAKPAARASDYERAIAELSNPKPHGVEFEYLQDKYEIFGTNDPKDIEPGVRDFNDPRLRPDWEIKLENGRIYRADGKRRVGWWWI